MKQILFATGNETKGKRFSKGLIKEEIEVLTLKDLDLKLDIQEDGKTAIENALIKARECYRLTKLPSMGMDDTLYLEGVPELEQPGLNVRRVNGKVLTDEEMIDHYINLVKKYGHNGRINCKWIYGLAIVDEHGNESEYTWYKDDFYFVDKSSEIVNPGYPLNSISKYKEIDKYFTELTEEDKNLIIYNEEHVVDFISNTLKKEH